MPLMTYNKNTIDTIEKMYEIFSNKIKSRRFF